VESRFEQVAPAPANGQPMRASGQARAVVLIHGYLFHFKAATVPHPRFRDWQQPRSPLVKRLSKEADVYSFSYGQDFSVDDIVKTSTLRAGVAELRKLGYREIVLIGHSAGGLLARQLVEDNPNLGVTKVIQVCAPNGGTPSAKTILHKNQKPFLDSLTEEGRQMILTARADKLLPATVDFVCLLGYADETHATDGVVPCVCQWTPDLRQQCVPVVPFLAKHNQVTRSEAGIELLAKLVREKQPRWDTAHVEKAFKEFFKKGIRH
jgi:pimeloyl-ACP methyl ester carboxylesterase